MAEFVKVTTRSELPAEGEAKEFAVGDKTICIARVNGQYAALDNVCVHRGGPLGQGVIDRGKLVCPWHGWQFDVETGVPLQDPDLKVDVYALKLEGDDVLVRVP
jgi:nitrite reductase (NADH) small subunit